MYISIIIDETTSQLTAHSSHGSVLRNFPPTRSRILPACNFISNYARSPFSASFNWAVISHAELPRHSLSLWRCSALLHSSTADCFVCRAGIHRASSDTDSPLINSDTSLILVLSIHCWFHVITRRSIISFRRRGRARLLPATAFAYKSNSNCRTGRQKHSHPRGRHGRPPQVVRAVRSVYSSWLTDQEISISSRSQLIHGSLLTAEKHVSAVELPVKPKPRSFVPLELCSLSTPRTVMWIYVCPLCYLTRVLFIYVET